MARTSLRRKSGRKSGGLLRPRNEVPPVRSTFLIVPSEISWFPSISTFSTRLSAPRSSSSSARAKPAPAQDSARATSRLRRSALPRRGDLTRRRLVVAIHGGAMLDGAGEIVEQHEDDESADQHEPHPLVREREPFGRGASADSLDQRQEQV